MEQSDSFLASKVRDENDEKALKELICRHSGIYIDMLLKHGLKSLRSDQYYDLLEDKDYQIYKAALEFDEEKSKFSTYLANKARYLCLSLKTKNKKSPHFVDFSDCEYALKDDSNLPDEDYVESEISLKINDFIDKISNPMIKQIFKERYFSSFDGSTKTWREVSEKVGISIQGCIDAHNRTLPRLKNILKNEQITF